MTGIDPRVMGSALETIPAPAAPAVKSHDHRRDTDQGNAAARPWPPPSRGPLPPERSIPPDLNIFTAQDEIDAWAHEHDLATEIVAACRRHLAGGGEDEGVEIRYLKERTKARRVARASPTERGRRTAGDIDAEVEEALLDSGVLQAKMRLETEVEVALGRLFRAKDNIARLDNYIRSLPRLSDGPSRR